MALRSNFVGRYCDNGVFNADFFETAQTARSIGPYPAKRSLKSSVYINSVGLEHKSPARPASSLHLRVVTFSRSLRWVGN
jgi:hypothetical protein